ncbi:MAG: polyprenyl synthetase family protein [Ruminiclostridium sp.]|nr:polyprenyl synthetase family protein [Ruminiclostridium sp.]
MGKLKSNIERTSDMHIAPQKIRTGLSHMSHNTIAFPEIKAIESEINNALSDSEGTIREMCSHISGSGGKRIRPLLVLYCGLVFSKPSGSLEKAAVSAELIHMATLVHDDIIDDSEIRRSRPTLNEVWGNHSSVLCGDYLFAKAFGILSKNKLYKSLALMVEAIDSMCNGEIQQAQNRFNKSMNLEIYYEQITKKTAKFLECCCKSGASIGNADERQTAIIGKYGLNLGLAFQIIDDILDFRGDEDIMGKPKGEDLRQGIITLPLIILKNSDKYGPLANDIINKKILSEKDYAVLNDLLANTGSIEQSHNIALSHIDQALLCLKSLPDTPYREVLSNLAEALRFRQN